MRWSEWGFEGVMFNVKNMTSGNSVFKIYFAAELTLELVVATVIVMNSYGEEAWWLPVAKYLKPWIVHPQLLICFL